MSFRSVIGGLALAALVSGVAGCSEDDTSITATTVTDNGQKIRVIGRVINSQTFAPVGASIELCGITIGGVDASGTFIIDIPGNITNNLFANQATGSATVNIGIRISAPGMATFVDTVNLKNDEGTIGAGDPGLNSTSVFDLGTIALNSGFTQKIVVTKDAAPLANAHVVVGSDFATAQFFSETCSDDQVGTTDSNGVVSFGKLDPFRRYTVIVPAQNVDGDSSGAFDFPTAQEGFTVQGSGAVFALDVDSTSFFDTSVEVTDDSDRQFASIGVNLGVLSNVTSSGTILLNSLGGVNGTQSTATALNFSSDSFNGRFGNVDGSFSGKDYITSADGSVTMVFSAPASVVSGAAGREISFRYFDNMADPSNTATFNKLNIVSATATPFGATSSDPDGPTDGTIWTFTPNTTIPAYTPFTLEFFARSTFNPANTESIGRGYMRIPTVATGLSSTINVTADNYNGTTGGDGGNRTVYFDFDRIVRGSAQIIEVTNENFLSSFGPNGSFNIENNSSAIVNNITAATATDVGDLGATTGLRFRVSSGQANPDDRTGFINSLRVAFAVEDIDGNELNTILVLPVK